MNLILFIICVVIAGIIMGGGVHFIPVGGAPAAMATATGVVNWTHYRSFYDRTTSMVDHLSRCSWFHVNDGYHHAYW